LHYGAGAALHDRTETVSNSKPREVVAEIDADRDYEYESESESAQVHTPSIYTVSVGPNFGMLSLEQRKVVLRARPRDGS
jgi:hypothetical protein